MNNAVMNIHVHIFCGHMFSFLLGLYLGVLCHIVTLCLNFRGTADFSIAAALLYIPTSNIRGFQLLHILVNTWYCLFCYSHSSECEVISHCGFNFHLSND